MARSGSARVERTAGGVVVRTIEGTPHALLIRDPYKKWGLPKGHQEAGETAQETALREVAEETGLTDLVLGPELMTIDWFFRVGEERVHKYTTFYLMYSNVGEATPRRAEGITDCEWVPFAIADQRISYGNASEVLRLARQLIGETGSVEAAD